MIAVNTRNIHSISQHSKYIDNKNIESLLAGKANKAILQ